jgi:hypothetical protein
MLANNAQEMVKTPRALGYTGERLTSLRGWDHSGRRIAQHVADRLDLRVVVCVKLCKKVVMVEVTGLAA